MAQRLAPQAGRVQADAGPWLVPPLRGEWRPAAAIALALLALYVYSMPRTVTLEDSGLFILSSRFAGIAHPPGYPLYSLLGRLFTLLPLGSVALRVHLLSAAFAAGSGALLYLIARGFTSSRAAACAASLGFGVSSAFWSQAIIAEVYSLNVFLFLLLLLLCLWDVASRRPERVRAIALVAGLGLAHHYPLFVLSLPVVVFAWWPRRRALIEHGRAAVAWGLVGLSPYLLMVGRSMMDPPISFYGPLDSVPRILHFVLRLGYTAVEHDPNARGADRLGLLGFLGREVLSQFTLLGAGLAAGGLAVSLRHLGARLAAGALATFLAGSVLLVLLRSVVDDFLARAVFRVYPLAAYAMMALWIGVAVAEVERRGRGRAPRVGAVSAWLLAGVVVTLSASSAAAVNVRHGDTWAREFGAAILESLPPDAVLFVHGDEDSGPIGYLSLVERMRPDVDVYSDQGLIFHNRLFRPPVTPQHRQVALDDFVARTTRPIFTMTDLGVPHALESFGPYARIRKDRPRGQDSFTVTPVLLAYLDRVESRRGLTDLWTIHHRELLLDNFTGLVVPALYLSGDAAEKARLQAMLDRLLTHFIGRVRAVETLIAVADPQQLLAWTVEAEALADGTVSNANRERLHRARARVDARLPRP